MTITTPQAEATVVGTRFSLSAVATSTRLEVLDGLVRLRTTLTGAAGEPREALVHAGETAAAGPDVKLQAQPITGSLASDAWVAPRGTALTDAPARGIPLARSERAAASAITVERLRGYFLPPISGEYTFWVATPKDEAPAEVWLSTDADAANRRRIAFLQPTEVQPARSTARSAGAGRRGGQATSLEADAQRFASQQSAPQELVRGRRYYIEIWHDGVGPERIALCWRLPGEPDAPPRLVDIQDFRPGWGIETEAAAK
jgi:hypothetical protein